MFPFVLHILSFSLQPRKVFEMKTYFPHTGLLLSSVFFLALLSLFSAKSLWAGTLHMDLDVSFDTTNHALNGTARFALAPGEQANIRIDGLEISRFTINGTIQDIPQDEDGMLTLPAGADSRKVDIAFTKKIDNAIAGDSMIDCRGIVLLDPWYPLPMDPAFISLSAAIPADFAAVAEADEISSRVDGTTKKVTFSFSHPLPFAHFIAGPYQVKEEKMADGTIVATYFFPEDQQYAQVYGEKTQAYLSRFTELIGPYPYKRYSVVENRLPTGFAMPTFTLLGQAVVRLPFITETSLGHEVLHSWFGNAVSVDYEQGNWCEGLTTYLADQAFAADKGQDVDFRKGQLIRYQSLVGLDNTMTVADFKDAGDFGFASQASRAVGYNKVSMIFHMLRKKVGDAIFYAALRDFYKENSFRSAGWNEIKQSFNKASGLDLSEFFNQWLLRADIPQLSVQKLQIEMKDGMPELNFELVQQNDSAYTFTVPIQVKNGREMLRQNVEVTSTRTPVSIKLSTFPPTMEIDPGYDLMRRLVPDELPAVWSRFEGGAEKIAVIEDGKEDMFTPLFPMLAEMNCPVIKESELNEKDLGTKNLLFLGTGSKASLGLFARPIYPPTGFTLEVRENPLAPGLVAALMQAAGQEQVAAVVRKLSHYGKYGYLHFEDGRNTDKKIPETDYGIGYILDEPPRGAAVEKSLDFDAIMDRITDSRVVYVGETHVNQADHVLQLRVLQAFHQHHPELAIGMEMFNHDSQAALDAYIKGDIDERQFLKDSQYFKNWGYDYRFYQDILQYARHNKLPVIALNLDKDVVSDTFKEGGIAGLPPEVKETLPVERDLSMPGYQERLAQVFQIHSGPHFTGHSGGIAPFLESQVLWDETMAKTTADYLAAHPTSAMIIIAGSGHVIKENAIPPRVARRIPVKQTVLLNVRPGELTPDEADYVFFSEQIDLPPAPMLGVMLAEKEEGPTITGFNQHSGAKAAGMKENDVILAVDGQAIKTVDDIRIALLYKKHGGKVQVKARRPIILLPDAELDFNVQL